MKEPIIIKPGLVFACRTLRWPDGWEFDCPSMMLSPVIRCFENGHGHDQIVEEVLIDAIVEEKLSSREWHWDWRGYTLSNLQRRWREARAGSKTTKYQAGYELVKITLDGGGQMGWQTLVENLKPERVGR